jgi:hypothetical protein
MAKWRGVSWLTGITLALLTTLGLCGNAAAQNASGNESARITQNIKETSEKDPVDSTSDAVAETEIGWTELLEQLGLMFPSLGLVNVYPTQEEIHRRMERLFNENEDLQQLLRQWERSQIDDQHMPTADESGQGGIDARDANMQIDSLSSQSEDYRQMQEEWLHFWMVDQPSHMTYERVHGGIVSDACPCEDVIPSSNPSDEVCQLRRKVYEQSVEIRLLQEQLHALTAERSGGGDPNKRVKVPINQDEDVRVINDWLHWWEIQRPSEQPSETKYERVYGDLRP